ncbi:MAG: hypothetical protein ACRDYB_07000 [Acidimicrobiales bacterium]
MPDIRIVSLTATGPDGVVVEVQLTGPPGCPADVLRGRLEAAMRHVLEAFVSGVPIEISMGDVWMSGRMVG